jgi:iron complex outermembrane receptor protein
MSKRAIIRRALISVSILSVASVAHAQEAPQASPAKEYSGLAEIVVTATKRNENLQDVPVAITAVTAEQLTKQGVFSTTDLNNSMPNLQVSSAYGETQPNFTVRGIGVGTEYNSNAASPVGIYVDEVYQSFRASHGQQLFDLEQIEVVRGPQGTLFGRNTTGGAINFKTRKPELGYQNGYLNIGYGSFNRTSAEGAFEVSPVEDKIGIRVAGNYVNSDSYVTNIQPVGLIKSNPNVPDNVAFGDQNTGNSPGGHESWGIRGQIRIKPTETIDLNFKAYVAQSVGGQDSPQNHGPSLTDDTISLADSAFGFFYTPLASTLFGNGQDLTQFLPPAYSARGRGLSDRQIEGNSIGTAETKTFGVVFNAKVELSDSINLTSISGYDRTNNGLLPRIDCDGTPYNVCSIGYASLSKSFNQDLRLDFSTDRFKGIVGVYYGWDKIVTNNTPDFYGFLSDVNAAIGNPADYFNPAGLGREAGMATALKAEQNYTQERKSYAIYGEASYELTDTVKVTAGLRFTKDKFAYLDALTTFFDDTGAARLYTVSDYAPGGVPSRYFIGDDPALDASIGALNRKDGSNALTGRAIIDWKPADDMLVYASYSRGYRGGTYNGLAFQATNQVYFVEPEKVDAFEIGFKGRFWDNRLQFNVSAFHYDYKAQQQQLLDPSSVTFLINLDGTLNGLDAELVFAATDKIRINAGLGILDSNFKHGDCPSAPISGTPPQVGNCISTGGGKIDVGGNPFPYASKVSGNIGVDWDVAEFGAGKITVHADTSYTGRYYYDVFGPYDYVGSQGSSVNSARGPLRLGEGDYWLVNGRISYTTDHFTIAGYVKNLTDKVYYPNAINVEGSYGSDYRIRAAPRTFGIEVGAKF